MTKTNVAKSAGPKQKVTLCSTTATVNSYDCQDCCEKFSSRNKMFAHIREKHDKLNGSPDQPPLDLERFARLNSTVIDSSVQIAGEDASYRVVVKPQGLPTMGKVEEGCTSLMRMNDMLLPNAFELNLPYKKAIPCHRLDSSTGGLVVCSKSRPAEVCIKMCFRQKLIHKRYRAMVPGRLEPTEGSIESPCAGKVSQTKYRVVEYTRSARYGWISTVDCWPVTGRKHQIRKHLLSVGHSILGDKRYSHATKWPERIGGKELMFLWSLEVEFPHPINQNTEIENSLIREENILKISQESEKAASEILNQNESFVDNDDDDDEGAVSVTLSGNTTSGGDANSIENRLLISTATQIREEMYGIETRRKVRIVIDEPEYYQTFRDCHQEEWELSEKQNKSLDAVLLDV